MKKRITDFFEWVLGTDDGPFWKELVPLAFVVGLIGLWIMGFCWWSSGIADYGSMVDALLGFGKPMVAVFCASLALQLVFAYFFRKEGFRASALDSSVYGLSAVFVSAVALISLVGDSCGMLVKAGMISLEQAELYIPEFLQFVGMFLGMICLLFILHACFLDVWSTGGKQETVDREEAKGVYLRGEKKKNSQFR